MLASETTAIATSTMATTTAGLATDSAKVASFPALPPGEEIYDLMGSFTMSYPWLKLLGEIAIIAISIALLWWFYSWITAPVERKRKPIVQSPEIQAKRAIKRLKLSDIWEKRNIKAICENVASILKNYTLDAYKISIGAAATTDEFIHSIIDNKIKNEILAEIREMLDYCDEVRYTGSYSERISSEDLVNRLEKLIETKGWLK